jgi:tetratricopeptide (TPR) repeat protein
VAAAARARALAEKSGNVAGLVQQLFATRAGVFVSGDYSAAAALSDQLLDLAEREGGHVSLGFAYTAQVDKCFYCGNLVALEEHFKRWDECRQAPGYRRFPGAIAFTMGHASVGAWVSGRADLARSRIAQAVTLAREDKSAFDLAAARAMESWLYLFLREPRHAEVAAAEAIALSDEHGFPFCRNLTCGVMGWAQAQRACADDGIALIRQGLAALLASGARIAMTAILSHLAEAQALGGRSSDALDTINKALEANPGELLYRPHVLTCRAELRLKLGEVTGADSDLRQAIELAQKMSAKAWELRATTSLARLLRDTNRRDEARTMLAEVYNWFIEGFDTADLKEAKALLDELSVSP